MKKRKRNILLITLAAVVVAVVVVVFGVGLYRMMVCNAESHDGKEHCYYVYPNTTLDSLLEQMEADYQFASQSNVDMYARRVNLSHLKPGYYRFPAQMSSKMLVNYVMNGWQVPIKVSFNNQIRTREQLAARLGQVLLTDSASIMQRLDSAEYLAQFGLNKETAVCLFLPNTYEMYWTISADELFTRMNKEYQDFWNDQRKEKAEQKGLTPTQVATLASIVESETNNKAEHPTIASLYINRLRIGMRLQACPTVIFATGDFTIHRVLQQHLNLDSPYNTYKYAGLPPGPIRCANGVTMDAVLDAPQTNYLFMCANPDWSGTHVFSTTYAQHQKVAHAYQRELNRRNIRK